MVSRPKNEEGRAEIQKVAAELFLKQGYAATSYADIAKATKRPRATVQSLFPKKSQLATNMINKLVYGCQRYAEENNLIHGSPVDDLHTIGQLYFAFLLSDDRIRTFTFDVISDREATSHSLLFNEGWVKEFLGVDEDECTRCMDGFVLAMGGSYEVIYQRLIANEPIDIPDLVSNTTAAFIACCGIEKLQANGPNAPLRLDDATLSDSRRYLRSFITC